MEKRNVGDTKTVLLHIIYSIVHPQRTLDHKAAFEAWQENHRSILDDVVTDEVASTYEDTIPGRNRGEIAQNLASLFLSEAAGLTTSLAA